MLKRLAAHRLPSQGLLHLRSSYHHAGRSTKATIKLCGPGRYHGNSLGCCPCMLPAYIVHGLWGTGEGQGSDEGVHRQVADTASFARRRDRIEKRTPSLLPGLFKIQSVVLNGTVQEFRSVTWI
jgi:hypothetical protein